MRILHILDHSIPLHSGYAFRTRSILEQQRLMGWETFHITSTKHFSATKDIEEVEGYRFYRTYSRYKFLAKLPILNQYAVVLDLVYRLKQIIREVKPDILHAHSPCLNGLAAIIISKKYKIPFVYELRASWEDAAVSHGSATSTSLRYRLSRALETYVLKRSDAITTICEGLKQDIVSRGISADKVTVIPNAVNPEQFCLKNTNTDHALLEKYDLNGKNVLGFIGSFYEYEGLDILLRSFPKILKTNPGTRVMLVGGGRQEEALKKLSKKLNIEDKVIFVGRVPHDEVIKYYSLIDLLVYPRRSIRLTDIVTPLKPLEAMASSKMFIASNVGGHKELIKDGLTGTLFEADDPDDLADTVCRLFTNRQKWPELLANARRYVETERTWQISVANYAPVYSGLVEA